MEFNLRNLHINFKNLNPTNDSNEVFTILGGIRQVYGTKVNSI